MYIKEIYIDNFGKLFTTTFGFNNTLNTIKTMHDAELTDALELVFGNKTDSHFLNSKTIIKAAVYIDKTYYVEIKLKKLQAFDENELFYEAERAKASDFDLGEFADISLYDVSGGDFYITTYTISI